MQEKNSPEGLVGTERRFVKFGGGLSDEQLEWMRQELKQAASQGQRALVFCHLPLHRDSGPPASLLWNFPEAMAIIRESGCVAAVFSGHAHQVEPSLPFCLPFCSAHDTRWCLGSLVGLVWSWQNSRLIRGT